MDPMERLKVSQEGITVTNSTNTVRLWNLKERKSEHAAKLGLEGSEQKCTGTSFKCTGTPYSKTGSSKCVPVHHLSVPVHPVGFWANEV